MKSLVIASIFAALLCTQVLANSSENPPIYHLIRTISLPGNEGWDYLYADSRAHRLYISRSTHVQVVDIESGKLVGDILNTDGVHGIAIDDDSGHGFTSNGRANTVTEFDIKTLQKIAEIPVGEGPDCIIYDPKTHRVFTFNGRAGTSTAVDARSGKVVGTVTLPGRPEYAVADGTGHIFNNVTDKSEIAEIDSSTLSVVNVWSIAPAEGPSGIAMDRKNGIVFSVCDNGKMAVLDAHSGKIVATPTIGNGPDACAFDPMLNIAFSSNGQDGTLTEVTTNPYQEVGEVASVAVPAYRDATVVPTERGARTMALDPATHHVFLVTALEAPQVGSSDGAAQPGGRRRRSYIPGSFVVLEYGP